MPLLPLVLEQPRSTSNSTPEMDFAGIEARVSRVALRKLSNATVIHRSKSGGDAVSGMAVFDKPGNIVLGGEMLATDFSLRYPVATFPNVRRGDQFEIGGALYVVSEAPQAVSDGLENVVQLRVAA